MDNESFITLNNVFPGMIGIQFPSAINWSIKKGEQWAVVGANGSGKTLLADVLLGHSGFHGNKVQYNFFERKNEKFKNEHFATDCIKKVSFESAYSLADYKNMYYQQRFSATENDKTPTVEEILDKYVTTQEEKDFWDQRLKLKKLYKKHIIMLSSGELRRFLIASIIIQKPDLLIFDNPFIGLDKETCIQLNDFFEEISKFQQMIFIVPALNEIPRIVTHIMPAEKLEYGPAMTKEQFLNNTSIQDKLFPKREFKHCEFPVSILPPPTYDIVLNMKNINISYPTRVLFKDLNWVIKKGEKWSLSGPNGSGKSTLLSLLSADNPKAYAQNIILFDKKRGSGETIWDIKKKIGYISSEMHLYFHTDQTCLKIVASGFYDTIGLFKKCTEEQEAKALNVLKMFGVDSLADKSYLKVSSGEQRLILLARTLVKNPDLLILDEPLHGLDLNNKDKARNVIEEFCAQPNKTMIYVTHREEEVPSCVDHFFKLKKIE